MIKDNECHKLSGFSGGDQPNVVLTHDHSPSNLYLKGATFDSFSQALNKKIEQQIVTSRAIRLFITQTFEFELG